MFTNLHKTYTLHPVTFSRNVQQFLSLYINLFPTNCTIYNFDAPTSFSHKPSHRLGVTVLQDTCWVLHKLSAVNGEFHTYSIISQLINYY